MTSIDFGQPDTFALFGGGRVMLAVAEQLQAGGQQVKVFTSPRLEHQEIAPDGKRQSDLLAEAGISATCVASICDCEEALEIASSGALGLSFGAPWIFSRRFIALWTGRLLNSHGAPLPEFRGGGGFSWRIMMGNRSGTSLLHQVAPGIDDGHIVVSREYVFPDTCRTPSEYESVAADQDLEMLRSFLSDVSNGREFALQVQDESLSSYFPRLHTPSHAYINWAWDGPAIQRFLDAFDDPYPGARTMHGERIVQLESATVVTDDDQFHPFQSGLIYRKQDGQIWIAASVTGITVKGVRYEDGSDAVPDIRVGDRLHTPHELQDGAAAYRAIYSPTGLIGEEN